MIIDSDMGYLLKRQKKKKLNWNHNQDFVDRNVHEGKIKGCNTTDA